MSQTNTNTNNDQDWNQIFRRDGQAKARVEEATAIAVKIAGTTWSQINIHSKEKLKTVRFPN